MHSLLIGKQLCCLSLLGLLGSLHPRQFRLGSTLLCSLSLLTCRLRLLAGLLQIRVQAVLLARQRFDPLQGGPQLDIGPLQSQPEKTGQHKERDQTSHYEYKRPARSPPVRRRVRYDGRDYRHVAASSFYCVTAVTVALMLRVAVISP